jgi:folate-binding protein YgfZ
MILTPEQRFHRWRPAACLRVSGEDSLTFLQGQFTNDLHQRPKGEAVYGLWLNQRGKVLADSFVRIVSAREAWIVSYFSPAAVIRERLEAYIIADDVVVEDVTEVTAGLTLFGDVTAPDGGGEGAAWSFDARRTLEPHREFIFSLGAPAETSMARRDGVSLSSESVERMRLAAGIPAVPADIGPADLPNEGGLESAAISYTKGCYLGQEVMARLKSMGQVRRRLLRVRGTGEPPPRLTALFQAARKVGELRSAARDGADWIGLAMISLVSLKREQGLALAADGAPVIRLTDGP